MISFHNIRQCGRVCYCAEYLNFKKRSDVDLFNVNSPEDYENLLSLVTLN